MHEDPRGDFQRADEANRLYWHTDIGVNQIADEMGLSKGALYGLVEPLGADIACPRCGGGLVYPNRTARERGFLSCPSCGFEEELAVLDRSKARAASRTRPAGRRSTSSEEQSDEPEETGGDDSTRILVGAGLVVLAAGLLVTRLLRRD
jgi:uncharacterized Zn finger protein (UPF0148 family)